MGKIKKQLRSEKAGVGVDNDKQVATVEGLEQGYVVCPSEKRFLFLFTFLKRNHDKKVIVFFNSCMSVKFHAQLLNNIDLPVTNIHEKQAQNELQKTFSQFCTAKKGILLCTNLAAKDIDIPAVDWIVQYDPPGMFEEYIQRVGQASRNAGHALLVLRPEELGFLEILKEAKCSVLEFEFTWNKVTNIQIKVEKLISSNYFLNKLGREAFRAYFIAYDSDHHRNVFNSETLNVNEVAKSFGFTTLPAVNLSKKNKTEEWPQKRLGGGGFGNNSKEDRNVLKCTKRYRQIGKASKRNRLSKH